MLVACAKPDIKTLQAENQHLRAVTLELQEEVERQAEMATMTATEARRAQGSAEEAQRLAREQMVRAEERIEELETKLAACQ